jgi:D-alanyl-D-alanine carboxypeptidase
VQFEIATFDSPPFGLIAAQTLKPSQNLYTELILRTLGKLTPPPATMPPLRQTSEDLGIEAVKAFLNTRAYGPTRCVSTTAPDSRATI